MGSAAKDAIDRRGRRVAAVALLCLSVLLLAGCGGSGGGSHTGTGSGGGSDTGTGSGGGSGSTSAGVAPQIEIQSCASHSSSSTGTTTSTESRNCTVTFSDGTRFNCASQRSTKATEAQVAATRGCRRLSSLKVPAAWRPAISQLHATQACLQRHGITTSGGPAFGSMRSSAHAAVGELISYSTGAGVIIGFFQSAADANRLGSSKLPTAARANIRVVSLTPKAPARWHVVTGCALGSA